MPLTIKAPFDSEMGQKYDLKSRLHQGSVRSADFEQYFQPFNQDTTRQSLEIGTTLSQTTFLPRRCYGRGEVTRIGANWRESFRSRTRDRVVECGNASRGAGGIIAFLRSARSTLTHRPQLNARKRRLHFTPSPHSKTWRTAELQRGNKYLNKIHLHNHSRKLALIRVKILPPI